MTEAIVTLLISLVIHSSACIAAFPSKPDFAEPSPTGFFAILHLKNDLTSGEYEILAKDGVKILEPSPPSSVIAWLKDTTCLKTLSEMNRISYSELLPVQAKYSPSLYSLLQTGESISSAIWIYELTEDEITSLMASHEMPYRSLGLAYLNRNARYRILQAIISPVKIHELAGDNHVRLIYPSPEKPGYDDELSAVEVMEYPFRGSYSPGYLDYLSQHRIGLSGPLIGYIDSGFDTNSNLDCHVDLRGRILAYLTYAGSVNFDYNGHGTHVGGILAGNGQSSVRDQEGFLLGMGLAPMANLIVSDALIANPFPPTGGYSRIISDFCSFPVPIISNSWHDKEGTGIGYTANCAIWDSAVRNATFDPYGSQFPVTIVFSAGNFGPETQTIASPKEAKNLIVVGACGSLRNGNPSDLESSSSRGPCLDGRFAPTLAAPGVDIISTWPGDVYLSSSGTSSACPHVSAFCSLFIQSVFEQTGIFPSPALVKAWLVGSAQPQTNSRVDNNWGWGKIYPQNFNFSNSARQWSDQKLLFTESGQVFIYSAFITDPDQTVDVILTWTDAPAAPFANPALVNDLDLTVKTTESTYYGNNFNGLYSVPEVVPDRVNNIERVCLPSGAQSIEIEVSAFRILGDAIPDYPSPMDQDFVLLVKNGVLSGPNPEFAFSKQSATCPDIVKLTLTGTELKGMNTQKIQLRRLSDGKIFCFEMKEVIPESGYYETTVRIGNPIYPDSIDVNPQDELTAIWLDQEASLTIDCSYPQILECSLQSITSTSTIISIRSDCATTAVCYYRKITDSDFDSSSSVFLNQDHKIELTGLDPCTWYECNVVVKDENGQIYSTLLNDAEYKRWITDSEETVYHDELDENPQWPQLDGLWEWGNPGGTGTPPDPAAGYTGSSVIGYNLSGNYEPMLTPQHAVSVPFDCSSPGEYFLSFYRWLGTESDIHDKAILSIRSRTDQWIPIWSNPRIDLKESAWVLCQYDITDIVKGNPDAAVRFTQGPTDPVGNRCGWNIDDITVVRSLPCIDPTPTPGNHKGQPVLELELNREFYIPGDNFILSAIISSPDGSSPLGFGAIISVGDTDLFYPDWMENAQFIELPIDRRGWQRWLLIDFQWPENFTASFSFDVVAAVFDPVSFVLYDFATQENIPYNQ